MIFLSWVFKIIEFSFYFNLFPQLCSIKVRDIDFNINTWRFRSCAADPIISTNAAMAPPCRKFPEFTRRAGTLRLQLGRRPWRAHWVKSNRKAEKDPWCSPRLSLQVETRQHPCSKRNRISDVTSKPRPSAWMEFKAVIKAGAFSAIYPKFCELNPKLARSSPWTLHDGYQCSGW